MSSGSREEALLVVAVDVKREHPRIQEWLMSAVLNEYQFQVALDVERGLRVVVTTARLDADN